MNTQEIERILRENTQWDEAKLLNFCERNQVKVTCHQQLMLLDYKEGITKNKWNAFNRSCRGLVIDLASQQVVAYPFAKFRSYNTEAALIQQDIPATASLFVAEKYDGTMICLFEHNTQLYCCTRSAFDNRQIRQAHGLIQKKYPLLENLFEHNKLTLIFEYIAPENKIHIDYAESDLVLLGGRVLQTGELLTLEALQALAETYHLRLAAHSQTCLADIVQQAQHDESELFREGWILRRGDELIKLKSWRYLLRLKLIKAGYTKKQVLDRYLVQGREVLFSETETLPPSLRLGVQALIERFENELSVFKRGIETQFEALAEIDDPKDFALKVNAACEPGLRKILFTLKQGKPIEQLVLKIFLTRFEDYEQTAVGDASELKQWAFDYAD